MNKLLQYLINAGDVSHKVLPNMLPKAEEGKEYKGPSIVDYLATKGLSGTKAARKELAKQFGVEDYDYSSGKNLELLEKLRNSGEKLQELKRDFTPVPVDRLEQMYAEKQNKPAAPVKKGLSQAQLDLMMMPSSLQSNLNVPKLSLSNFKPKGSNPLSLDNVSFTGNRSQENVAPVPKVQGRPMVLPPERQTGPMFMGQNWPSQPTPTVIPSEQNSTGRPLVLPPAQNTDFWNVGWNPINGKVEKGLPNTPKKEQPKKLPVAVNYKNITPPPVNAMGIPNISMDQLKDGYEYVSGLFNGLQRKMESMQEEDARSINKVIIPPINNPSPKSNTPLTKKGKTQQVAQPTVPFGYKQLYAVPDVKNPKDSLVSFMNTFDNEGGGRYYIGHKAKEVTDAGAKSRFNNAQGVAHFLRDSDILPGQKITPESWEVSKGYTYHTTSPGKTVSAAGFNEPERYRMLYRPNPNNDGTYLAKYVKNKDISPIREAQLRKEGWGTDFTVNAQHKFSDIAWDKEGPSTGYAAASKWLPLKNGSHTYIPYKNKDGFSRFSGGSGIYLFKDPKTGKQVGVDVSGSVNTIRKIGDELVKTYGIKPEELELAYHDMGSYSAKPKAHGDVLDYNQWLNYNSYNRGFSGAPMVIPKNKYGGIYQDGGEEEEKPKGWFGSIEKDLKNLFGIKDEPRKQVVLTMPQNIKIKDQRKNSLTTGRPLNPNVELLSGEYPSERIHGIVKAAKRYGIDPYTALAIDLQETGLGKRSDAQIGHTLVKESELIPTLMSEEEGQSDPYDYFARAIATKMQYADKLGIKDPLVKLQAYNGLGKVFPKTEKKYHGFEMDSIYGVPLTPAGIDLRQNPLYGKRVSDIRDNVLMKNPDLAYWMRYIKQQGGPIVDPRGQWAHPGKVTRIPSNQITMKDVPYPVYGVGNNGQSQMMYPEQEYNFGGASYVDEYPIMNNGGQMIRRADGSYSRRGLWDNIRENAGSGKKPTKEMLEQEHKIKKAQMGLWNTDKKAWVDSVNNANVGKIDFVQRFFDQKYGSIPTPRDVKGWKPGQRSTHLMAYDPDTRRVYPEVVNVNGKLQYMPGDLGYNYAEDTEQFIKFPTAEQADWYSNSPDSTRGYKMGTGVLRTIPNAKQPLEKKHNIKVNYK